MKLPNDLIKATDYSKAKDREIHEFEYRNGKYIHKYVLGGEHELTPQEIVNCLNAISTIDCDLQTAYAFIQGQKDKISDLEAKLAEKDQIIENLQTTYQSVVQTCGNDAKEIERLREQIAESEKEIKYYANRNVELLDESLNLTRANNQYFEENTKFKHQLAQKDKQLEKLKSENHALISDNAYQEADMFEFNSRIEQLQKQLAEKEQQIEEVKKWWAYQYNREMKNQHQDKISFAVEQLTQAKEYIKKSLEYMWNNNAEMTCRDRSAIDGIYTKLDEQIEELTHQHEDKGENNG